MGTEIERKFLVRKEVWAPFDEGTRFRQGYLNSSRERVVRVRIEGDRAKLTIKGPGTGLTRPEFEYDIPLADAAVLLDELCEKPLIDKHRHVERHGSHRWEIDVFHGENEGLVVAEVELASEDEQPVLPPWVGPEVTSDPRYLNANLIRHPYADWR